MPSKHINASGGKWRHMVSTSRAIYKKYRNVMQEHQPPSHANEIDIFQYSSFNSMMKNSILISSFLLSNRNSETTENVSSFISKSRYATVIRLGTYTFIYLGTLFVCPHQYIENVLSYVQNAIRLQHI